MQHGKSLRILAAALLCLAAMVSFAAAQGQRQAPPEYKEVVAATQIKDTAARLKEFERIKAAYPNAQMAEVIDTFIINAKVELAPSLDEILALQKTFVGLGAGSTRLVSYLQAASQILEHPKFKSFDKNRVLNTILQYKDGGIKTAGEPQALSDVTDPEQRKEFTVYFRNSFELVTAQALLNAGQADKALAVLNAFRAAGGAAEGDYFFARAEACAQLGKTRDAYEAYLAAAVVKVKGAADKARELYVKLNGNADGFEAGLDAKIKELPYQAEPFKAPAGWKGKTVLAEIFTGSECPPCVGADLGFDGLIETYPVQYLAILEYHLPIPRPDPMINEATRNRQIYYDVRSTPSSYFDGEAKLGGGGSRGMAEGKFKAYKAEIDGRLAAEPELVLKAQAVRTGDVIKVDCTSGKTVSGAEIHVALVQKVEAFKGGNGLLYHKMIVRDMVTLPEGTLSASFDLAASEQAADKYLTDFEKTSTRFQGYKFAERHARIDRQALRIVVFAQMKDTKKVLNAAVVDVK